MRTDNVPRAQVTSDELAELARLNPKKRIDAALQEFDPIAPATRSKNPAIRRAAAMIAKRAIDAAEVTPKRVLQELANIAFADTRELIGYHKGACRYCHGDNHEYQHTPAEWAKKVQEHPTNDPPALGGLGFNPKAEPHPECPECFGEGEGRLYMADTRKLPSHVAALFAGVEVSNGAVKIKVHPKTQALEMLGRHLKMFTDKIEVSVADDLWERVRKERENLPMVDRID